MNKEQKFYDALKDIFIGAKVEGESGYINLMRIKSHYYEKGVFPQLQKDIDKALEPFPGFREELFDKLYTFFNRYFSESGSIYFRYTPIYQNVYEKVYTDDKDVILFWKTHMLYYVKTDRLFKNLEVDVDDVKFFFDVSTLEHKKANEKRTIIYELKEKRDDGVIIFNVLYSEKGKVTKINDILRDLRKEGVIITEDTLEKASRVFEKQSEVDYFINKNAKEFLQEQFNIWLYQYVFSGESEWTEKRIKQLQVLKDIAFKIINFISQFEDELVKIWNKPKFALNSNYVITLDRIAEKSIELIEKILKHEGFENQVKEWEELGIVGKEFDKSKILENAPLSKQLNKRYQYLPIDTKYFKDLELEILGLFDDLDNSLDGWLIKSENYQALNTILQKFKDRVRTIYIDPPYNTGNDEFIYKDKFKHSSWLTMIHNRMEIAKYIMSPNGVIFVSIGDLNPQEGESYKLQFLLSEIFDKRFGNLIWKKRGGIGSFSEKDLTENHEYLAVYGNRNSFIWDNVISKQKIKQYSEKDEKGEIFRWMELIGPSQQTKEKRPNLNYGIIYDVTNDKIVGFEYFEESKLKREFFDKEYSDKIYIIWLEGKSTWLISRKFMEEYYKKGLIRVFKTKDKFKVKIKNYLYREDGTLSGDVLKSILSDNGVEIGMNIEATKVLSNLFPYLDITAINPKPVSLIRFLIYVTCIKDEMILDFFAGSGTTAHAVMKLNKEDGGKRKFILIEMADYFDTVIIPRIKKVAYSFNWKNGKPEDSDGIGVFFKYYELEQYEDTLRKVKYEDSNLFDNPYQDLYNQYVFMRDLKMLEALEIDYENNKVKVDLSKLYSNIDIPETLSNLLGKWIKKITPDYVEFENGEQINLKDLNYKVIKPLIWW